MEQWEYREIIVEFTGQTKVGRETKSVHAVKLIEWTDSEKGITPAVLAQHTDFESALMSARVIMARLGKAGWELAAVNEHQNHFIFKRRDQPR